MSQSREMLAFINSSPWQMITAELEERIKRNQHILQGTSLLINSTERPIFDSLHEQDMFLKGALDELHWMRDLPQHIAEGLKIEEGEA